MKLRSQSCASRRVFVAGIARHPLDVCVKIKFLVQTPQNSRFSHRSDGWNCSGVMITLKRRAVVASRFTHSPTLFFLFLQRSLQQVRYLKSAPRTVECRPRVKGRSLSFPLRIYRLGWKKKWPFYSCTQFSFSDSLCHIHLLEDGIADLQVAGEEPSIADVDAYLDVWLFIVTASSIFDGCNFMVRATVLLNP